MAHTRKTTQSLGIFAVAAAFYGLFYSLNDALILSLDELPGAHLFRLSSGIKLILVLLLGWIGAASIATFCFVWTALYIFPGEYLLAAEVAAAAGLTPLLACRLFERSMGIDLIRLNWQRLFLLSLTYASLNAVVRESIVYWHAPSGELLANMTRMFCTDLLGVFAALYALHFILRLFELPRPRH